MSDDFFNSVPFSSQNTNKEESVDSFAQAIAARFGSADLLTARLLPDARKDNCKQKFQSHDGTHLPKPSIPLPPSAFPPLPTDSPKDQSPSDCKPSENPPPSLNQSFTPVSPSELATYVSEHPTLTLDIRPHAAHASARIDHALSLSVPSTLLKRPLFSLCKLAQMIPSTTARSRFSAWPEASRILVYDADSTHLPHNSNIAGLLRKFRAEGFTGELGWIKGGFQAVWREARHLTTTEQPSPEDDDMEFGSGSGALRTKRLPKSAFSVTSTTLGSTAVSGDMSGVAQTPAPAVTRAANPFFDAIRQNVELSQGITERIPLRLPRRVRRRINDLPFAWLREIARRSTVRCFPSSTRIYGSESESSDEPYASDPDEHDPKVEEGTEALAMQFYRIELAEQRRLWTVMEHHSRENEMASTGDGTGRTSTVRTVPNTPHPSSFPFAITAGVEKGAKNRYTHIWPFEHARVRLHDGRHQGSHPGKGSKGKSANLVSGQVQEGKRQRSTPATYGFGMTDNTDVTRQHHSLGIGVDKTAEDAGNTGKCNAQQELLRSSDLPCYPIPLCTDKRTSESRMSASGLERQTDPMQIRLPFVLPSTSSQICAPDSLTANSATPSSGARNFWSPITAGPKSSMHIPSASPEKSHEGVVHPDFGADRPLENRTLGSVRGQPSPQDDYVNASYVQPLGTRKKYIATQGPLPATFLDFWTLVWEQNVHVIVMLTREVENAMVKCGTYWTDTRYGPFRLELLSTSPPLSPSRPADCTETSKQGFFFALREPDASSRGRSAPTTIIRRFALSHTSYPGVPPRHITHLQYLDWPDLNVPDDPRGILDLVKRVESAVAESTPGPSPNESFSPDSSLSPGSASPGPSVQVGQVVHKKRGHGWRHPELDPATGIAASTLGKPHPVLLHCSAGVGRTGGFIAVDAVLDGIRRELRKVREKRAMTRAEMKARGNRDVGVETGTSGTERTFDAVAGGGDDGVDSMDVDGLSANDGEPRPYAPVHQATAPIHVTAGERKKGRKHHGARATSSESLVVHVPIATAPRDADNGTTNTQLEKPRTASWKPSSTREWAEQVSDQTHTKDCCPDSLTTPVFMSAAPATLRTGSPGSSNSSGPSVLNSADDSVGGLAGGSSSGNGDGKSTSGSVSGSGSSRACVPPSSSASISHGSGSVSASNSNSGNGSRTGSSSLENNSTGLSSVMRSRLADSSATSLSNISTGSPFPRSLKPLSGPGLIQQPSAVYRSSNARTDMDVDEPPRAVSVPPQRVEQASLASVNLRGGPSQHAQGSIGSSPVASLSAPSLTAGTAASNIRFGNSYGSSSPTNSSPSPDELMSPCREFESGGSADADSARSVCIDKGNQLPFPGEAAEAGGRTTDNCQVTDIDESLGSENKAEAGSTSMPEVVAEGLGGDVEDLGLDTKAKNPIIDYKLPRELHLDLSPPLLSSYQNPICMVVQDMREQRMSLCQSLRQYVFVHAAVIEGALQIVDEERELWGDSGGSDGGPELPPSPFSNAKGWVGSEAQEAWVEDASSGVGGDHYFTTAVPSSSIPSLSCKGKRGPSPTELLKEDKTGALSLAKRPSVKRKAPSDDEIPSTLEGKTYPATGSAGAGIAVPFGAGPSAPKTGSWPGMAVE